jgi:Flp pilus assembly protein TadD
MDPSDEDPKAPPRGAGILNDEGSAGSSASDIGEFHPWDPHKAAKDVEVGDYYFKRKNYKAAEDRYREALYYKNNDAMATYRLAICLEKLGEAHDARAEYESYLKILPHGPEAADAQKAIDRLAGPAAAVKPAN